jgi:hypothetical protein
MAEHATKKPNTSDTEPVEVGVILFFLAAAAALVVWQALHMPEIAKWVLLGGLGLHALIAIFSSFGEAMHELNKNPSFADRRNFGLIFLVGTAAIGVAYWQLFDHDLHRAQYFFGAGAGILVLSLVPGIGRLLYLLWMGFGLTLGLVTSPIIMFLLFLVLITPVGFVFKMTGRDTMRRQLDDKSDSYWEDYPKTDDPSRYVKQF